MLLCKVTNAWNVLACLFFVCGRKPTQTPTTDQPATYIPVFLKYSNTLKRRLKDRIKADQFCVRYSVYRESNSVKVEKLSLNRRGGLRRHLLVFLSPAKPTAELGGDADGVESIAHVHPSIKRVEAISLRQRPPFISLKRYKIGKHHKPAMARFVYTLPTEFDNIAKISQKRALTEQTNLPYIITLLCIYANIKIIFSGQKVIFTFTQLWLWGTLSHSGFWAAQTRLNKKEQNQIPNAWPEVTERARTDEDDFQSAQTL